MSLLADLLAGEGVDPGYAEAATRRGEPRGRLVRGSVLLAATLVIGVLGAAAITQVRLGEPAAQRQRRALIAQIRQRTAETDGLQRQADSLRERTEELRRAALARSAAGRQTRQDLDAAAAAAATAPVEGAALLVTVDDAPASRDNRRLGQIYDQDIQDLVNGLWAAGATAVAVNGQRVTATTAIRSAGDAILVDYRPLSEPYVVAALGDPGGIRGAFTASPSARALRTLKRAFGTRYDIRQEDSVRLPAAPAPRLRYAHEVPVS
jgi:uncharacterized protein YlxW (UPF0749 family)